MCIRDRVKRAYADWRRYPQYIVPLTEASIDLIFAPAYGSSKKNATDTVSYTHLRAHETVLDLVCRLLLEKNKTKKKQKTNKEKKKTKNNK